MTVPSTLRGRVCSPWRDDLDMPLISSNTEAEREAETTQVNGRLYTIAKGSVRQELPRCGECPAVFRCPVTARRCPLLRE